MDRDLTITEAAGVVNVHPETLRRMVREGKLEAYRVNPGARRPDYRITPSALQAYREQKRPTTGSTLTSDAGTQYRVEEVKEEGPR